MQRYIAEEIATDHVDGLMSRREALRRMALLGIGAGAASALITACAGSKVPAPGTSGAPSDSPAPVEPPPGSEHTLPTEPVNWTGPHGELEGAWSAATDPKGAVLVVHENKGLNDWTRSVAGRFAGSGYSALAIDLLSGQGGTGGFTDPAAATAALGKIPAADMVADLKSGVDELARRAPGAKLAAVGFCMGGGLVWQLLGAGEPRLAAAVPFYGPAPENPDFGAAKDTAVLAFYGALDDRVTSTQPIVKAALENAGLVHDLVTEPGANHAFFNDTGERYDPAAAADAWQRSQDWFSRYLS